MSDTIINMLIAALGASFGGAITWGAIRSRVASHEKQLARLWENSEKFENFKSSTEPALKHYDKTEDKFSNDIAKNKSDITKLQEKVQNVATLKEVRDEFVSRKELELHIQKFESSLNHATESIQKVDTNLGKLIELLSTNVVSTLSMKNIKGE